MWWLAVLAPVVGLIVFMLTGGPDKRRDVEVDLWRKRAGNPRRITALPGPLARILGATGGGTPVGYFELAQKLAYLAIMGADAFQGSEHATVVAKLDEPGPTFTARPLPILEGERIANTGVEFKKDEEFMDSFLVERSIDEDPSAPVTEAADKAIRKWLSPPLREALLELPEGWLRVDGKAKTMALTVYGPADHDRIEALIATADIVFAEYGAEGGPSLLPEEGAGAASAREEEEEDEAPKATASKAAAVKAPSKAPPPSTKKKPGGGKPAPSKR